MLSRYHVALCQTAPLWMAVEENLHAMGARVAEVASRQPDVRLVIFPERATSGSLRNSREIHGTDDLLTVMRLADPVPGRTSEYLGEIARKHTIYIACGFIERDPLLDGVMYNSCLLVGPDGRVVGVQRKCHLSFAEADYFRTGDRIEVFETDLGRLGLSICYDLWFPEFVRRQALAGSQLHVNVTNNFPTFITGNVECAVARAVENEIFVAACNRVGTDSETGKTFGGLSRVVAPDGNVLAEAGPNDEALVIAEIDLEAVTRRRLFLNLFKDRRADLY